MAYRPSYPSDHVYFSRTHTVFDQSNHTTKPVKLSQRTIQVTQKEITQELNVPKALMDLAIRQYVIM